MTKFPRIQRMCPYKNSVAEFMDGDVCRICSRQVHDLGAMNEAQRMAFLSSCSEEVCVSYALPIRRKAAAVALSAAIMALPAAADEPGSEVKQSHAKSDVSYEAVEEQELMVVVIGGIKEFSNIEYVDDAEDPEIPELPVTYEDRED